MPRVQDIVTEATIEILGYRPQDISDITKDYENPTEEERLEKITKLWEGHIRTSGHNIIERAIHCDFRDDIELDAAILSWSDNGKTRAYVWKPNGKINCYEFAREYTISHVGESTENAYDKVMGLISDDIFGRQSNGKIVVLIQYEGMLL